MFFFLRRRYGETVRKRIFKMHRSHGCSRIDPPVRGPILLLLFGAFLAGTVLGAYVGSHGEPIPEVVAAYIEGGANADLRGFFRELFSAGQYHFAVLFAATSTVGVFAIPLVSFLRGYFLSCTAAAIMAALPECGIAAALVLCGGSAVLTVPSLFLLELDSFELSRRLRAISTGHSVPLRAESMPFDLALSALCILIAALAECLLVPALIHYFLQ